MIVLDTNVVSEPLKQLGDPAIQDQVAKTRYLTAATATVRSYRVAVSDRLGESRIGRYRHAIVSCDGGMKPTYGLLCHDEPGRFAWEIVLYVRFTGGNTTAL